MRVFLSIVLSLFACLPSSVALGQPAPVSSVAAPLIGLSGQPAGAVTLTQGARGVLVSVAVSDLPPGAHGLSINREARCLGPDFATAGARVNPGFRRHGFLNPEGPALGDLPNVTVGPDGRGQADAFIPEARLQAGLPASLLGEAGGSLIVYAKPDDYRSDPHGNVGARVACAVLVSAPLSGEAAMVEREARLRAKEAELARRESALQERESQGGGATMITPGPEVAQAPGDAAPPAPGPDPQSAPARTQEHESDIEAGLSPPATDAPPALDTPPALDAPPAEPPR